MAISIPIVSEFSDDGVKKAIREFKQLETTGEKAQYAIKKAAAPAIAALGGLAIVAKDAVAAASDMEEAQSKVNVIFGEGAKDIEAFAKTASKKIGQSARDVMAAAGEFGTFGKAAGLSGRDLANFSTKFTALASDMASFNNTSPEEAIAAIGAGLRGEAEPLRRFGVLLNDATLKAEAMKLGIYDGSGALTDQQKILAAQAAIFKQTGDAQGDFDRTSDGLANTQRTLKAQIDDVQVVIGKSLLPVVEAVVPFIKKMADWAVENPGAFKIIAGTIAAVAASIVLVNIAMAANPFTLIATGIGMLVTGIVIAYKRFETFRDIVRVVVNGVSGYIETMANNWIQATNIIIRGLNLINPFKDIPYLGEVKLGRIGGDGGGSRSTVAAIAAADMPGAGGGAGGGSGAIPGLGAAVAQSAASRATSAARNAVVVPTGPDGYVGPMGLPEISLGGLRLDQIDPSIGGTAGMAAPDVTINVNGGDPNAVVDALREYMRQNGSIPIEVSGVF